MAHLSVQHPSHSSTTTFLRFGRSFEIILNRIPLCWCCTTTTTTPSKPALVICFVDLNSIHLHFSAWCCIHLSIFYISHWFKNLWKQYASTCTHLPTAHWSAVWKNKVSVEERVSCLQSDLQYRPWGHRLHPSLTGQLAPSSSIKLHCRGRCS